MDVNCSNAYDGVILARMNKNTQCLVEGNISGCESAKEDLKSAEDNLLACQQRQIINAALALKDQMMRVILRRSQ